VHIYIFPSFVISGVICYLYLFSELYTSSLLFLHLRHFYSAPGYKERILFPMDLSLVRKMIVARMIKSFASLHQRVGLICHNCVKFNGRESDYAVLTRDFEEHVDDKVLEAVKNATAATAAATAAATTTASATASAAVLTATATSK